MTTFDETFADHNLTHAEREALVWHLASFRSRKTIEALLLPPPSGEPDTSREQIESWRT